MANNRKYNIRLLYAAVYEGYLCTNFLDHIRTKCLLYNYIYPALPRLLFLCFFNLHISFRSCGAESMSPLSCLSPSPSLSLSVQPPLSLSLKLIHPFAELEAQHCLPVSSGGSDGKIHAERDNSQLYQSRLCLSIKTCSILMST